MKESSFASASLAGLGPIASGTDSHASGHCAQEGDFGLVSGGFGALEAGVGDLDRSSDVGHFERTGELCFDVDVESMGTGEGERPLKQNGAGAKVTAPHGAPAGEPKPGAGSERELLILLAEPGEIEGRLLEVIAEDLLELDEALAVLLKPRREAPVEIGARRLRESLVGGISDQEMAEAIGVVAR